jgi:hypothetical protein
VYIIRKKAALCNDLAVSCFFELVSCIFYGSRIRKYCFEEGNSSAYHMEENEMLWKDDMLNISQAVNILDHIKSSREDKSSLLDYFILQTSILHM